MKFLLACLQQQQMDAMFIRGEGEGGMGNTFIFSLTIAPPRPPLAPWIPHSSLEKGVEEREKQRESSSGEGVAGLNRLELTMKSPRPSSNIASSTLSGLTDEDLEM